MKLVKMIILFLVIGNYSYGQLVYDFNVTKTLTSMRQLDKSWGNWFTLGNMDKEMKQTISIDLLSDRIYWDTQFIGDTVVHHVYEIIKKTTDYKYKEHGFWALIVTAKNTEDKVITNYTVSFDDNGEYVQSIMTWGNDKFKSKYYLDLLK